MIESYHIEKSEYGIITLLINTSERWVIYVPIYKSSDINHLDCYTLEIYDDDSKETLERLDIPLSEFPFDHTNEKFYIQLEQQNKDQIAIYWIPVRLLKGDEFVNRIKS